MIKTLNAHKYAQAHVEIDDRGITLWSYKTPVLYVENDGWASCSGLYSRTTIKHIGWFMREYFSPCNYHDVKRMVYEGFDMNFLTGEIRFN